MLEGGGYDNNGKDDARAEDYEVMQEGGDVYSKVDNH